MRFVNMYLVGYFVLIIGAALALWKSGVFAQMGPVWIAIGMVIALGLGIMMAVSMGKPTVTKE